MQNAKTQRCKGAKNHLLFASLRPRVFALLTALLFCLFFIAAEAHQVIICGVCKDAEKQLPVAFASIEALSKKCSDYRVVIYENNSKDNTKLLLRQWAAKDPKILVISEDLSSSALKRVGRARHKSRTESIARARNIILDEIMKKKYDNFPYVVMADLDMLAWDVEGIVATLDAKEPEWDAVCANGGYDRFAFRSEEFPFGAELLGKTYWKRIWDYDLQLSASGEWKKVYSAFGGLGIYKREAIRGCRYSGVVTAELETLMEGWIREGMKNSVFLAKEYEELLKTVPIINVAGDRLVNRKRYPSCIGMKLHAHGAKVVWFGVDDKIACPITCEHITFHAAMITRGRDKIYINPNLKSMHP